MNMFLGHRSKRQHIQALYDCHNRDDKIVDLFQKKLEEVKDQLVAAEDEQRIRQLQGQASVLKDFLEAIEKSGEVLARIDSA